MPVNPSMGMLDSGCFTFPWRSYTLCPIDRVLATDIGLELENFYKPSSAISLGVRSPYRVLRTE